MGGMLVAARVLLALVEREAGHRVRRAAGISAVVLAALFVGLAGLLFLLYAVFLAITPYLTPAGAAAVIGGTMVLVSAILIAVTFRSEKPVRRPVARASSAASAITSDLGTVAMEAGRKLGSSFEAPSTITVALAALIAGLVAGRKI
ncbi:MAG TPA: phage holin family protein [Aliidongia sp.]|uniref:phage holin family protein n=1 Tax=Aliidongia sp. TaxID=1914230 RepID=UPI002DDCAE44|nr:phage holin family protein [Aliidongia sp.]HEV2674512.1 phage holin family protein [Aliidongia sp.]